MNYEFTRMFSRILVLIWALSTCNVMTAQRNDVEPGSVESEITVRAQLLSISEQELRIEATITNSSRYPIFLIIEPRDVYGHKGFYVSLCSSGESEVSVASRLYPRLNPPPAADGAYVEVMKLAPSKSRSDVITLRSPLRESMPPTGSLTYKVEKGQPVPGSAELRGPAEINLSKLKAVYLSYGYFEDTKGVTDFLRSESQGWYLLGFERVEKDSFGIRRTFLDIQKLATVKLNIPAEK